ncbi:hypothetical protein L1987_33092 [Smallanthus sonchifolius]|uniref:Uncharacterized protein n=1 Tax=Smallanthus sonchifolius TaxID=185202 RepID=A0ACB9HPD8_9ASTR|nr:hypothetical protein L1987_33092 [Smallanthus sonchifolius]
MRFQNAQSFEFKSDLRFTFVIKENISVDYHYHFQNTNYSQETVQIISQASNPHSRSNYYQLIKELDPPIISKVSEGLEQPESQQKPPEANLAIAGTPFYRSLSIPFCLRLTRAYQEPLFYLYSLLATSPYQSTMCYEQSYMSRPDDSAIGRGVTMKFFDAAYARKILMASSLATGAKTSS